MRESSRAEKALIAKEVDYMTTVYVHLLNVDPPGHTRLRSLVNIAFTPKRIKDLEPSIRQITNDLLDEILVRGGEIEFVRDFAFPLPVIVIAELLGVPPP
jgi:cytochrome P450